MGSGFFVFGERFFHLAFEGAEEVVPGGELVGVVVHEVFGVHASPEGEGLAGGVNEVEVEAGVLEGAQKLPARAGVGGGGAEVNDGDVGFAADFDAGAGVDESAADEVFQNQRVGCGRGRHETVISPETLKPQRRVGDAGRIADLIKGFMRRAGAGGA